MTRYFAYNKDGDGDGDYERELTGKTLTLIQLMGIIPHRDPGEYDDNLNDWFYPLEAEVYKRIFNL